MGCKYKLDYEDILYMGLIQWITINDIPQQCWIPDDPRLKEYFDKYHSPVYYKKAAMTTKFAKWLCKHCPDMAIQYQLSNR